MKKALIDACSEYCVLFTVSMIKLRNLRLRRWRPSCWGGKTLVGRSESWDCLGKTEV